MRAKFKELLLNQLRQGATPEGLARSCAVAALFSVFPLLGTTMVLCLMAGFVIRGNQPVIHLVNYLLYPAQLLLIPVYLYIGEWMVGAPHVTVNPVEIGRKFIDDFGGFMIEYGWAGLYAILAWALLTPPLCVILYFALKPVFRRFTRAEVP